MKCCSICKETKSYEDFSKDRRTKDGLQHRCKACFSEYKRKYRAENQDKIKSYQQVNKDKIRAYHKTYQAQNRERTRTYVNKRYATNLDVKVAQLARKRICNALKGRTKSASTIELIGCSIEELKAHIENQFQEGMTWENHGYYGWHIDHIVSCASFDLNDPEQQRLCFHYSNLQPMWAKENIRKGG